MTAIVEQARAQDMLFQETGIEEEMLLQSIEEMKLEQDAAFVQITKDYMDKAINMAELS